MFFCKNQNRIGNKITILILGTKTFFKQDIFKDKERNCRGLEVAVRWRFF